MDGLFRAITRWWHSIRRPASILERLTVLPIPPGYKAGGFDCGEPDVDDYICDGSASEDETKGLTRTYLIMDGAELVGYVSVLCDHIRLGKDERLSPQHPGAPALKVGRMGVRKEHQGHEIGSWILDRVVGLARSLARQAGLRYVTLDALPNDTLVNWYAGYGFRRNLEEARVRKIMKSRPGERVWSKEQLDAVKLPHISMRYDILLEEEVTKAPG